MLKTAIIGYGKMGKIREACIRSRSDMEIIALCDVIPPVEKTLAPFYSSYQEILTLHPDVVFVCTANKFLSGIVCDFLKAGTHVFCEKPAGRTKEDAYAMLEAAKAYPKMKLKFGFNHRYHQSVLDAQSIIDKGRFGDILWMRGVYGKGGGPEYDKNWRNQKEISGGGILIDQGIHMIDLFSLFCGDFIDVQAIIQRQYWDIEVEDNAFVMLRNSRRQVAMFHSSATQWKYKFLLEIYLQKGYITIDGILSSTRNYGTESLKIARCRYNSDGYPLPNPEETMTYYEEDNSWKLELEEFVDCIRNDHPVRVGTCEQACATMELIEKIYTAGLGFEARSGKGVI